MKEIERTFLASRIPQNIDKFPKKEVLDIYIPKSKEHPTLRIRKSGNRTEMTKKEPLKHGDSSVQVESTIQLTPEEFSDLEKIEGKRVRKMRYEYPYNGKNMEIDIFQDGLEGLVLIDVEFESEEDKNKFEMPDFCLADVTQEKFTAGGMLCGKTYTDIEKELKRFDYKKLYKK
jgi:CYTH domain-containing protein